MKETLITLKEKMPVEIFLTGIIVLLVAPIIVGWFIGGEVAQRKFETEYEDAYKTIATEILPEVEQLRSNTELTGVKIILLQENHEKGGIIFDISEASTVVKYSCEEELRERYEILWAICLEAVWIMFLIVIWLFKYEKKVNLKC